MKQIFKGSSFFQIFKWQKKIGFSESSISAPGCLQALQTQKAVWALESFMAEGNCIVFSFTPQGSGTERREFWKRKKRPDLILAGKLENAGLLAGTYRFKMWNKVGIHCRAM